MKTTSLIPPALALIAAALWTGSKYQSLSAMQADNADLRERIISVRTTSSRQTAKRSASDLDTPINWQLLATEAQNGPEMMRFNQRLPSMAWQELVSTLDKVSALECSEERRVALEFTMVASMGKLNPKWVLDRFSNYLRDQSNNQRRQLPMVFSDWLDSDFATARAWYAEQSAAGVFRAKTLGDSDRPRAPFEAAFLLRLMSVDPDDASRRLAGMSEDMQSSVMSGLRSENSNRPAVEQKDPELARLVRQSFPPEKQAMWIFANGPYFNNAGYHSQAVAYLDRIEATPAERVGYLERFAGRIITWTSNNRSISDDDIETARGWFREVSPESVDSMTGRALSHAMSWRNTSMKFAQASEIAVRSLDATGSDEVLATLLETATLDKSEQKPALQSAAQISDESRRAAIIRRLESLEFP